MVLPQVSHRTRQEKQSWAPQATGNPQAAWRQVPGWEDVSQLEVRLQEGESHFVLPRMDGTSTCSQLPPKSFSGGRPGGSWSGHWRSHPCRNLCLKLTAYNNQFVLQQHRHAGGDVSFILCLVLSSTRQILTIAAPLVHVGSASPPVMEDVIEKMLCIHIHDQILVSQGFLISSLDPCAAL